MKKTLCYYIEYNVDTHDNFLNALFFIMRMADCTVQAKDVEMNYTEITIVCDETEVVGIQTVLAPYL